MNTFLRNIAVGLLFLIALFVFPSCNNKQKPNKSKASADSIKSQSMPNVSKIKVKQKIAIPQDRAIVTAEAKIRTSMGTIIIGLYGKDAPKTVENFIELSKNNYYRGVLFHRIAKNFLIQTGDGLTKSRRHQNQWGTGGISSYGKEFDDELNPETPSAKIGYVSGTVAMANRGANTNTSQFFICLEEAESLEFKWTIFGRVLKGMDVVRKISEVKVKPSKQGDNDGLPVKPVRIYNISIKENK